MRLRAWRGGPRWRSACRQHLALPGRLCAAACDVRTQSDQSRRRAGRPGAAGAGGPRLSRRGQHALPRWTRSSSPLGGSTCRQALQPARPDLRRNGENHGWPKELPASLAGRRPVMPTPYTTSPCLCASTADGGGRPSCSEPGAWPQDRVPHALARAGVAARAPHTCWPEADAGADRASSSTRPTWPASSPCGGSLLRRRRSASARASMLRRVNLTPGVRHATVALAGGAWSIACGRGGRALMMRAGSCRRAAFPQSPEALLYDRGRFDE
jgi:hypothetical protein